MKRLIILLLGFTRLAFANQPQEDPRFQGLCNGMDNDVSWLSGDLRPKVVQSLHKLLKDHPDESQTRYAYIVLVQLNDDSAIQAMIADFSQSNAISGTKPKSRWNSCPVKCLMVLAKIV